MGNPSLDLRRRMVLAYENGLCRTYQEVAAMFGVGPATVSRNLRRKRETGDVMYKRLGGNRPRVVDERWLAEHATAEPDARLRDRVEAWHEVSGVRVALSTMSLALKRLGWSFKKRHQWRGSAT